MMRRNRSTTHRATPSPLVVLISAGLMLALVGLVFWPRHSKKNLRTADKPTLHRATVQPTQKHHVQPPVNNTAREGELRFYQGTVRGALPSSMRDSLSREDAKFLSALAARLLIWRLDLRRDLRRGDYIRVAYKPIEEQSRFEIQAMTYKSLKHRQTFHFYRFKESGRKFAAYYDKNGRDIELQLRNTPMREYEQVTSILKMRRRHKGVDFKAPEGAKIYLPWRARVVRTNWNMRYNGQCVKVQFFKGRRIHGLFLHLSKVMPKVRRGAVLPAGTVIGLVGNTGRSTAAHLHYQLETRRGRVIDPFDYHKTYHRKIPSRELAMFQSYRRQLDRQFGQHTRK
ncbi:MAG TPA: hypothetical protein DCE42_16310 [Myxococcales bacterium]|nr:hypothetical protein [Deltaproteobacteria bacterium]HAA56329.1 hypothetical protein [Myxococcales bacterium]